jgi:hypothetical protein
MKLEEAYAVMQNSCGIDPGDTVKVLRSASSFKMGWRPFWNPEMDRMVGKNYKVTDIDKDKGVCLDSFWFPFFVLEKVSDPKKDITITISGPDSVEKSTLSDVLFNFFEDEEEIPVKFDSDRSRDMLFEDELDLTWFKIKNNIEVTIKEE